MTRKSEVSLFKCNIYLINFSLLQDVPIEFEFLRIFEDIKLKKPNFKLIHGPVISSGNTADDLGKRAVHPYKKKEPVLILDEHIVVNDMRLLDILQKYDTDGTFQVTPEDFVRAVEVCQSVAAFSYN